MLASIHRWLRNIWNFLLSEPPRFPKYDRLAIEKKKADEFFTKVETHFKDHMDEQIKDLQDTLDARKHQSAIFVVQEAIDVESGGWRGENDNTFPKTINSKLISRRLKRPDTNPEPQSKDQDT